MHPWEHEEAEALLKECGYIDYLNEDTDKSDPETEIAPTNAGFDLFVAWLLKQTPGWHTLTEAEFYQLAADGFDQVDDKRLTYDAWGGLVTLNYMCFWHRIQRMFLLGVITYDA